MNQYNGGYNSFSPYMNSYNQQQYVSQQVVKVNGENGANAYQMAPNSSALLLDEKDPLVYLVQTDGAGYKTVSAYSITKYEPEPHVNVASLEERIKRLE